MRRGGDTPLSFALEAAQQKREDAEKHCRIEVNSTVGAGVCRNYFHTHCRAGKRKHQSYLWQFIQCLYSFFFGHFSTVCSVMRYRAELCVTLYFFGCDDCNLRGQLSDQGVGLIGLDCSQNWRVKQIKSWQLGRSPVFFSPHPSLSHLFTCHLEWTSTVHAFIFFGSSITDTDDL